MKQFVPRADRRRMGLYFAAICTWLALTGISRLPGATIREIDENSDGVTDQWIEIIDSTTTRITKDRDFDGRPDYSMVYDERARKISESLDFNFDGQMDDFYYYVGGVLKRREIDTDFDGRVDLWVYLFEGVYLSRVERDLDGDGEIDFVKEYILGSDE